MKIKIKVKDIEIEHRSWSNKVSGDMIMRFARELWELQTSQKKEMEKQ